MKRKLTSLLLAAAAILSLCAPAKAASQKVLALQIGSNRMVQGSQVYQVDSENAAVVPIIQNDRTLVPVSQIVKMFGGTSSWDGENRTATFTLGEHRVKVIIDGTSCIVDSRVLTMDVPAQIINDRTYVPLRAVLEGLGLNVGYVASDQIIVVSNEALNNSDLTSINEVKSILISAGSASSPSETSSTSTKPTGVTITPVSGTDGANSSEEFYNIFDRDSSTKWCVTNFSGAYAIFSLSQPVSITGVSITTGGDNSKYPGRNPKSWKLYGSNEKSAPSRDSASWKLAASVTNDSEPRDVDLKTYKFSFKDGKAQPEYQHYKLEISENNGDYAMQLSEFTLNFDGSFASNPIANWSGGSSGSSGGSSSSGGNYHGIQTVLDGSTFEVSVGDRIILKNPRVPAGTSYAFSWYVNSGSDLVKLDRDGPTCGFDALKAGTVKGLACLDYSLPGLNPYHYEYSFTIKISEASASSGSGGSSSGNLGGSSSSSDICRYCNGQKTSTCKTCYGKGYIEVRTTTPKYTSGVGGTKTERKPCTNIRCHDGKVDCSFCGGKGYR